MLRYEVGSVVITIENKGDGACREQPAQDGAPRGSSPKDTPAPSPTYIGMDGRKHFRGSEEQYPPAPTIGGVPVVSDKAMGGMGYGLVGVSDQPEPFTPDREALAKVLERAWLDSPAGSLFAEKWIADAALTYFAPLIAERDALRKERDEWWGVTCKRIDAVMENDRKRDEELVKERDALRARIAELESLNVAWEKSAIGVQNDLAKALKRIAELEHKPEPKPKTEPQGLAPWPVRMGYVGMDEGSPMFTANASGFWAMWAPTEAAIRTRDECIAELEARKPTVTREQFMRVWQRIPASTWNELNDGLRAAGIEVTT